MSGYFDRTLSNQDVLRRRASLLQRMHIDGQLLLLLLLLDYILLLNYLKIFKIKVLLLHM